MDARTKKFIEDLNSYLNTLYTLNYACLKAGARGNQNVAENKSAWLDEKMAILSNQRNNWISAIQGAVLDLEQCGFNAAMATFKKDFMATFEEVYGPSASFDELFDGFKILHPQFKKDFFNLDILCKVSNEHPKYNLLCYNYLSYLNYYKQKISYESYAGIFSELAGDLQYNGYKSFYFQRPSNDVYLVSEEKIQKMVEEATQHLKRAVISTKTALRKHNKTYKKASSPKATEQAIDRFAHFKACFEHEENQQSFVGELHFLTKILESRMKFANTPSNTKLVNTLYEDFWDLMSGVNIFDDNNNYHAGKIYVHKNEVEYYNYLMGQINTLKKYEVKENESQITQKQQ
jgi:hypothetical protein